MCTFVYLLITPFDKQAHTHLHCKNKHKQERNNNTKTNKTRHRNKRLKKTVIAVKCPANLSVHTSKTVKFLLENTSQNKLLKDCIPFQNLKLFINILCSMFVVPYCKRFYGYKWHKIVFRVFWHLFLEYRIPKFTWQYKLIVLWNDRLYNDKLVWNKQRLQ